MALQLPLAGSYSSALARSCRCYPPATSTLPLGSNVAVSLACGVEAACGTPAPAGRVVQFRARKSAAVHPLPPAPCRLAATSPCEKRAVLRLPVALQLPLAGSYSSALVRAPPLSPCHQHLAVGQQRRRVKIACGVEAACGTPAPARWVVQFRAGQRPPLFPLPPAPCRWAATSPCEDRVRC